MFSSTCSTRAPDSSNTAASSALTSVPRWVATCSSSAACG